MKLPILLGLLFATHANATIHLYDTDCARLFATLNIPAETEWFPDPRSSGSIAMPGDLQMKIGRGYEAHAPGFLPHPEAACSFEGNPSIESDGSFALLLSKQTGEHLWSRLNVTALPVPVPSEDHRTKYTKSVGSLVLERSVTTEGIIEGTYVLTNRRRVR